MELTKAIEILEDIRENGTEPGYPIDDAALKLGIEALKRLRSVRSVVTVPYTSILPGEDSQ